MGYRLEISKSKNLTIIVSTHSITMIKRVNEKNILLLDTEDKKLYNLISPCYHARAIGTVDYIENVMPDIIFYVEDDMAELFLRNSFSQLISIILPMLRTTTVFLNAELTLLIRDSSSLVSK